MNDTLLRDLRNTMLQESEPLAGLLRKCLLLGAETGSVSLRDWARRELNGYGSEDEVPEYRKLHGVPISMNYVAGYTVVTGQIIDRFNLPANALEFVPEFMVLRQPVETLERQMLQSSLAFQSPGLSYAQALMNDESDEFQQITGLSYVMAGSALTGVVGQVRTKLVDLVADLTADTPPTALPDKKQVDEAVSRRVGDVYNTTIHATSGPVAVGAKAKAKSEGLSVAEVLELLDGLKATVQVELAGADFAAEVLEALADLRDELAAESPDTGEAVKKAGRLRKLGSKLGGAAVVAATEGAAGAVAELAMSGVLG